MTQIELTEPSENLSEDAISSISHVVQTMDFTALVAATTELIASRDFSVFKIGAALAAVQDSGGWQDTHAKFHDFMAEEFDLDKRVGYYYIKIYDGVLASNLEWSDVAHLGWTKLRILASVFLKNIGVPADWVEKADPLTCAQLSVLVKEALLKAEGKEAPENEGGEVAETVHSMTFKLHNDQKEIVDLAIEAALLETGSEFNSVALDGICQLYLASQNDQTVVAVTGEMASEYLKNLGLADAMELLGVLYPEADITVAI